MNILIALQVQALLKVTNSSVNIENLTAEERRTLFSIEQVAALVRLDNRGGIPQKIGRKLSGQGRKGIADVLFRSADVSTSTEDGTRGAVDELMAQWRKGYGLDDPHMDEGVALPETVPRAPHLDDCKDLDTMNRCVSIQWDDRKVGPGCEQF